MRFFPRVLLQWREPAVLKLAGYREGKQSLARMMPVILIATLLIVWAGFALEVDIAGRICAAAGVVIVLMYVILWLYKLSPSWVRISEKGIGQSVTDDETVWKFETIDHCEITTTTVEGRKLRMLVIATKKGNRHTLGIADRILTEELRATLGSRGVKVMVTGEPVSGCPGQGFGDRRI